MVGQKLFVLADDKIKVVMFGFKAGRRRAEIAGLALMEFTGTEVAGIFEGIDLDGIEIGGKGIVADLDPITTQAAIDFIEAIIEADIGKGFIDGAVDSDEERGEEFIHIDQTNGSEG